MNRRGIKMRTHLLVILFAIVLSVLLERLAYLHYDSLQADPVILNRYMAIAPVYNRNGSWLHGRWGIGYRFDLLCLERMVTFLVALFLFRFLQAYNTFFSMSEKWLYAVDIELAVSGTVLLLSVSGPANERYAFLGKIYVGMSVYGDHTQSGVSETREMGELVFDVERVKLCKPLKKMGKGRNAMPQYAVKKLEDTEITFIYDTYMRQDFPADELKPLSHIIKSVEEGYGFSLGLYEEERLAGYAVFILCEETRCALLDYFAILSNRRGEGLGHRAFLLFDTYFKEKIPQVDGLYVESERIVAAKKEEQRLTRERRIAFYQSCGCEMTNLRSVLFGVDYSILYMRVGNSAQGASLKALDMLYRRMFKPEHYERCVRLTDSDCRHPEETV